MIHCTDCVALELHYTRTSTVCIALTATGAHNKVCRTVLQYPAISCHILPSPAISCITLHFTTRSNSEQHPAAPYFTTHQTYLPLCCCQVIPDQLCLRLALLHSSRPHIGLDSVRLLIGTSQGSKHRELPALWFWRSPPSVLKAMRFVLAG